MNLSLPGVAPVQAPASRDMRDSSVLVAVLNWNRPAETIACLESLRALDFRRHAVLVLDNGSEPSSLEPILAWASDKLDGFRVVQPGTNAPTPRDGEFLLCQNRSNLGYAGGNNVALDLARKWRFDWTLILNNDGCVPPDYLRHLLATAAMQPRVGIVGSRSISPTDPTVLPYEGGRLMYELGVHLLWRWHGRRGSPEVNFVPGNAALIRMQMLEEIGFLDERYFLYSEDVELSLRALHAGWRLLVNLDVTTEQGVSTSLGGRRKPAYYYYVTRNTLLLITEKLTGPIRLLSMACFVGQSAARWLIWSVSGRQVLARAVLIGVRDFLRGRFGQAPADLHPTLPVAP
jgi:GT2 family glycosyltransferase